MNVERDAAMTRNARDAFEDFCAAIQTGFMPRDSQLKLDLTRTHLAGKEMAVGRYYLNAGHYGAAISRFNVVVRDFDTTNQVPEALYRLAECYLSLGLRDEAMRVLQVAEFNFANSIWTERA